MPPWLGLTTGCAECHDHKFDPITARDFYSLGAFFADVRQWGVYADYGYTPNPDLPGSNNEWPFPPEIHAPNAALRHRLEQLRSRIAGTIDVPAGLPPGFQSWLEQSRLFLQTQPSGWQPLRPDGITTKNSTAHALKDDDSIVFTGEPAKEEAITLRLRLPDTGIAAIRLEVLPCAENKHHAGRRPDGKFAIKPAFAVDGAELKFSHAQADRRTPQKYKNGSGSPQLEAEWHSAPALWEEPKDAASRPHHAVYHLATPMPSGRGKFLTATLTTADAGRVRLSVTPFRDPVAGDADALSPVLRKAFENSNGTELAAAWKLSILPDAELPEAYKISARRSSNAARVTRIRSSHRRCQPIGFHRFICFPAVTG